MTLLFPLSRFVFQTNLDKCSKSGDLGFKEIIILGKLEKQTIDRTV